MSQTLSLVITGLGWFGALIGLVAYAMVSKGRWAPNSLPFQTANLTATSTLFLVAAVEGVWPSVFANVAWMVIGAQALMVMAKARRTGREHVTRVQVAPREPAAEPVVAAAPAVLR
ncbi:MULTISPECIES: hypothetical protein [Isoptericola]|uniref:CBU_0592 family membrane protein n=1 Tax=Isoptericola TaxID=254250 RepID=UPI001C08A302|nr:MULTISPECIES: hypothetical protein [Isoptericola]MDO8143706.1 hypothetical protein [Isoptericola sp. 178]MDO8147603.1 hypothetical protein [Isoptericola sp. b515]MDO8150094.1 hypothetical protein [Isoptericola sp. b408]